MRDVLATTAAALALFLGVSALSQLAANSRYLARSGALLRTLAAGLPPAAPGASATVRAQLVRRALVYESEVAREHLVDGLLVNRTAAGLAIDTCDSLLFSSLRFVGLDLLGMRAHAAAAWAGLRRAESHGRWVRHPRCARATSRDMIFGVLAALSRRPPGADGRFRGLVAAIEADGGYVSQGPVYVSRVSPGLARAIARLAPHIGLAEAALPAVIRDGYSTHEYEATVIQPGFEAHLVALNVWLELEADAYDAAARRRTRPQLLDPVAQRLTTENVARQRLEWTAHRLVALDPSNLFFRYLRLRTSRALTSAVAAGLAAELLAMREFPPDRLPADCDRGADYLWQRAPRERRPDGAYCDRVYGGADFTWMAGLLAAALDDAFVADGGSAR